MKDVYTELFPDFVMVQGNTSTTTTTDFSVYNRKIPIAHVEAGLRTGNFYCLRLEEANRRLTVVLSGIGLAITETAKKNLL